MKKILVIIPAYNEAATLKDVMDRIKAEMSYADCIVVNDGSRDNTDMVCRMNHYDVLDLPVNLGLAGAFRAGMRYADYNDYDFAVQIDGDGQHDPKYIKKMLKYMEDTKADIVIGSRFKDVRKPLSMRMVGSKLISGAIWLTTKGKYIGDVTSGMRLYNKRMIAQFANGLNYRPEPDTLAFLLNHDAKIEEIQVEMGERIAGASYLNVGTSTMYMIHVLFNILFFQWVRRD